MIKGFAHICFNVLDLEKSIKFYSGALGFKHGFDFINDKGVRFGVYLHIGGRNFIELFENKDVLPAKDTSYKHFCLEVDNLEETVKELNSKNIATTPIKLGSDNSYQSWLEDPDGNKIELHYYTPKSKQLPSIK